MLSKRKSLVSYIKNLITLYRMFILHWGVQSRTHNTEEKSLRFVIETFCLVFPKGNYVLLPKVDQHKFNYYTMQNKLLVLSSGWLELNL